MEPILIFEEKTKYSEKEIHNISNEINDLQEIFADISSMIAEQGEILDILEDDIELTKNLIESGSNSLKESEELNKDNVKKKSIITGLGITATMIPLTSVLGPQITIPLGVIGITGCVIYRIVRG